MRPDADTRALLGVPETGTVRTTLTVRIRHPGLEGRTDPGHAKTDRRAARGVDTLAAPAGRHPLLRSGFVVFRYSTWF